MAEYTLAVTVKPDNEQPLQKKYDEIASGAQYAEFKLDDFVPDSLKELTNLETNQGVKNIITINRPLETKGKTKIDKATVDKVEQLLPITHMVDVDIGYVLKNDDCSAIKYIEEIMELAHDNNKRAVVSWHDYNNPSNLKMLKDVKRIMGGFGADIYKIITFANKPDDCKLILDFVEERAVDGEKVISWAMGEHGKLSRVIGPLLGGYLTFAGYNEKETSAPGQLPLDKMISLKEDGAFLPELLKLYRQEPIKETDKYLRENIK